MRPWSGCVKTRVMVVCNIRGLHYLSYRCRLPDSRCVNLSMETDRERLERIEAKLDELLATLEQAKPLLRRLSPPGLSPILQLMRKQ